LQKQIERRNRIIKAGNYQASPIYFGQEKAEELSAMMRTKRIPAGKWKTIGSVRKNKETVKKLLATIAEREQPTRKISQDSWFCFLKQTSLETRSQDQVKNGKLRAGNNLTSPSGQEKAEKSSAMMRTKQISVRMRKATGSVRKNKEAVRKLLATIAEI
jgi:aminopeptidase N